MKYTLTIKDNETGEIVREIETNAIIAGVTENGGAEAIALTECTNEELFGAIMAAKNAVKHCVKRNSLVRLITAMAENEENVED